MDTRSQAPVQAIFVDASGTILQGAYQTPLGVVVAPDATALLEALLTRSINGNAVRTGLITNWGHRVHRILKTLKLEGHFDAIVCADDVPHPKPDASIFLTACASVDVLPQNCLHIGDALFDDALAAQHAGLQSVWINRGNRTPLTENQQEFADRLRHPHFPDLLAAFGYLKTLF